MKIVYLDSETANPGDLSWQEFDALGELVTYGHSTPEEGSERGKDADILIVNKFIVHDKNFNDFKNLKYIVVSATGYNNIQLSQVNKEKVAISNVVGYSTTAVAQHVFSALFALYNRTEYYNYKVRKGAWSESRDFCFYDHSIEELAGKTMGIVGYGTIGQKVAQLAAAFGAQVLVYNKYGSGRQLTPDIRECDLEEIFSSSDVLSLHVPLNDSTRKMIRQESLQKMKKNAVLINTSRGGLIDEPALAMHLEENQGFFALLDVLSVEPPSEINFLTDLSNCLITPHQAWASRQARERLLKGIADNIRAYLSGEIINRIP